MSMPERRAVNQEQEKKRARESSRGDTSAGQSPAEKTEITRQRHNRPGHVTDGTDEAENVPASTARHEPFSSFLLWPDCDCRSMTRREQELSGARITQKTYGKRQ